ncbi:MAG: hypothetical protein COA45_08660 [Zetaproteobacteria bacterium]|nr:MAG: hypothetical protein COA45_08660 [Zetaproteobacteria bacterium]
MNAGAAELWNKGSYGKKSGKTYFNKSKSTHQKSHSALFNRKGISSKIENRTTAYKSYGGYGFYKEVRMSKQKPSKQWRMLSSTAARNRQNDTDFALQQEYRILKDTAQKMNIEIKKEQAVEYQNYKNHQKRIAQYKLDRAQGKLDEEIKRDQAYARLTGKKKSHTYSRTSSKNSGRNSGTRGKSTGLKKPNKLFNDIH